MANNVKLPDYNPQEIEPKWYKFWEEKNLFKAESTSKKPSFTIVIPPPNVTGSLHLGHALYVIQDALIRWKRMSGFNTLWLPGTDHAGIATQNVVEKEMAQEGVTRHDVGRDKFLEKVWGWKKKHGNRINEQLRFMGFSLDWSREHFTMDEDLSRAVREVFVRLYEEGLIYRGHRLINWCVRCHTALSDLEVDHEEREGKLWYLKYPFKKIDSRFRGNDKSTFIVVATTRPETMLGDTAVAVNPQDKRYKNVMGHKLILPLVEREIELISDDHVEKDFGTGAVKVTPGHDFNDFEMGLRHGLEQVSIFDIDGKINENVPSYQGLDRFQARKKVLEDLKKQNLLEKEEDYKLNISLCSRCETVVEPRLSTQWFVKTKPLAKPAMKVVKEKKIKIIPSHYEKIYFHWMNNIQDWCISRQLWWGHRIPAWYCGECGKITVSRKDPSRCEHCKNQELCQDPDVLDTWFSSALWPFSTLGWPKKSQDLKTFYPNTVMETGHDILFFWVARMVMMGLKFMKKVPFKYVYLHPLVLDKEGKKMSKSSGNTIDPLDVTAQYGADALRYNLLVQTVNTRSINFSLEQTEGYRNFMNKIWNASRFALNFLEPSMSSPGLTRGSRAFSLVDQWILTRLQEIVSEIIKFQEAFKLGEAAQTLYQFIWGEFCDWYLEFIKPVLYGDNVKEKEKSLFVLETTLKTILKLLHPFAPHISEEIWAHLSEKRPLIISEYPKVNKKWIFKNVKKDMNLIQGVVNTVRNIRGENNISPSKKAPIHIICNSRQKTLIGTLEKSIMNLSKASEIHFEKKKDFLKLGLFGEGSFEGTEIFISLGEAINREEEKKRLQRELEKLEEELKQIGGRLHNKGFLSKAPQKVVDDHKARLDELVLKRSTAQEALKKLKS
ncbi:MAG: valine--tRNA ligase [Deltaproteobacteria bacterium]|nr:valine--tRNA ligase [Deltaproteobacteria bacterium]